MHLVTERGFSVAVAASHPLKIKCEKKLTLEQRTGERQIWTLNPNGASAAITRAAVFKSLIVYKCDSEHDHSGEYRLGLQF